jgi:hypothetical protein
MMLKSVFLAIVIQEDHSTMECVTLQTTIRQWLLQETVIARSTSTGEGVTTVEMDTGTSLKRTPWDVKPAVAINSELLGILGVM